MSKANKVWTIITISVLSFLSILFISPIPQDIAYHNFIDSNDLLNIPNFMDVISNFAFIIVGAIGILKEKHPLYFMFFFSIILVGLGSGYYHLEPSNHTLVWDRLPMAMSFGALFSIIIYEKISQKAGFTLLPILMLLAIVSVMYWAIYDDLRFYAITQFLPMVLIPLILIMFPSRKNKYFWFLLIAYFIAKVLEYYDYQIYSLTNEMISGHSLKHIIAAIGIYGVILYRRLTDENRAYYNEVEQFAKTDNSFTERLKREGRIQGSFTDRVKKERGDKGRRR